MCHTHFVAVKKGVQPSLPRGVAALCLYFARFYVCYAPSPLQNIGQMYNAVVCMCVCVCVLAYICFIRDTTNFSNFTLRLSASSREALRFSIRGWASSLFFFFLRTKHRLGAFRPWVRCRRIGLFICFGTGINKRHFLRFLGRRFIYYVEFGTNLFCLLFMT